MADDRAAACNVPEDEAALPAKRPKTENHEVGREQGEAYNCCGDGDDAKDEEPELVPRPKADKGKTAALRSPEPTYLLDSDPDYDEDNDSDWHDQGLDGEDDYDTASGATGERASTDGNDDGDDDDDDDTDAPLRAALHEKLEALESGHACVSDLPLADEEPTAQSARGLVPKNYFSAVVEPFTDEEREHLQEIIRERGTEYFWNTYVAGPQAIPPLRLLQLFDYTLPRYALQDEAVSEGILYELVRRLLVRFLRRRRRLEHVANVDDVVELLRKRKNIMVITGAGVSVSCGIPDFRSPNGIYSRLDEFELDDPQQMFDIRFFKERPEIFYSFAKEIFPSNFKPSPCHMFVKLLENKGKLLRNYTQNIDTLEVEAKIENVLMCHGSFATASCITCGHRVRGSEIKEDIFSKVVPTCKVCGTELPNKAKDDEDEPASPARSVMKPDIVFFGEPLPSDFHNFLPIDREKVDLLIVMGSSLKVAPVSEIMACIPHSVPQVLINRTPITHMVFDVQLLGDADTIVTELCRRIGWDLRHELIPGGSALSPENLPAQHMTIQPGICVFEGAVLEDSESEESVVDKTDDERELVAGAPPLRGGPEEVEICESNLACQAGAVGKQEMPGG